VLVPLLLAPTRPPLEVTFDGFAATSALRLSSSSVRLEQLSSLLYSASRRIAGTLFLQCFVFNVCNVLTGALPRGIEIRR